MPLSYSSFAVSGLICMGMATTSWAEPVQVPAELSKAIIAAPQGGTVQTGTFPLRDLPELDYDKTAGGPAYFFSDNPEYLRFPECVPYRDTVRPGVLRLYVYHVNGTTGTIKKITPVIENLGTAPLHVRFLKRCATGPSTNYYGIAKQAMAMWFTAKPEAQPSIEVPVGGGAPLCRDLEGMRVKFDELIHAFHEIEIDQPARITIVQTDPEVDSVVAARRVKDVMPGRIFGAGRGLFPKSDYAVQLAGDKVYDTASGPAQITVADGKRDPWIVGVDNSISTPSALKGNYGVVYKFKVRRTSSDGRGLALLVYNARTGGKWCDNMAAAMTASAGQFPAGVVQVPTGAPHVTGLDRCVVVQVWPPVAKGKEDSIEFEFTPPGASCLPVPLVLVPVEGVPVK